MYRRILALAASAALLPLPVLAQAAATSRIVGIFNIIVGAMLTVALALYVIGFAMWWVRLNTWPSYRTVAIEILEWAVAILFTLVVLLGIVQFFQRHQTAGTYVISAIVIIGIIWIILYLARNSGGEDDKKKH